MILHFSDSCLDLASECGSHVTVQGNKHEKKTIIKSSSPSKIMPHSRRQIDNIVFGP